MDSASALKIEIYLHGQDVVLMGNEEEKTKPLGLIQHIDNKCEKVMEGMCCRKFTRALFTKENYDKIPRGVGVMPFFDIYFWNFFQKKSGSFRIPAKQMLKYLFCSMVAVPKTARLKQK